VTFEGGTVVVEVEVVNGTVVVVGAVPTDVLTAVVRVVLVVVAALWLGLIRTSTPMVIATATTTTRAARKG
jgi:hypothetical protein